MRSDRTWWFAQGENRKQMASEEGANLVSSLLENGKHSPVLDIDFRASLIPSSTFGHFHLYLDGLELEWPAYVKLLAALRDAGVIQEGYFRLQTERGATFLRPPGVVKVPGDGLNDSSEDGTRHENGWKSPSWVA
jgi:hypothetical protein